MGDGHLMLSLQNLSFTYFFAFEVSSKPLCLSDRGNGSFSVQSVAAEFELVPDIGDQGQIIIKV